ncbi:GDSL-type esterase/lipase family protein [Streptomyces sp. DT24]|uniref:GDSL-type esterase/lipase family protein n=1 Tax=Streptomyces sp. DT24 TaxID=3416520 RepID=UPI003CF42596
MTWLDPEPFPRGVAWRDGVRPVRAAPGGPGRLPWDIGQRALLPVGVRLEFLASGAGAVEIRYRLPVPPPGGASRGLAHAFALRRDGRRVAEVFAEPAEETVVGIGLPPGEGPFTVYPPRAQSPLLLGVRAPGGTLRPAPARPRWFVHGDSITEGRLSTLPDRAWPAAAGRASEPDPVDPGYAEAARGELATAEQLAELPADLLTPASGTNCWSPAPFPAPLYETVRAFVSLVRLGLPRTPPLPLPPLLRPATERTPNALGATPGDLRTAMEDAAASPVAGATPG